MANPKGKKKFLLWIYPSTQELVKNNYRKDHCKSQSEFIERAIQYYVGRVNAEDDRINFIQNPDPQFDSVLDDLFGDD